MCPESTTVEEGFVEVTGDGDVPSVVTSVGECATELGFEPAGRGDLEDIAETLAQALHEHGGGGRFTIYRLSGDDQRGIRLAVRTAGPANRVGEARFTTDAGGFPGSALENITMDEITVTASEGTLEGTRLVADRWLTSGQETPTQIPVSVGGASRASTSDTLNGDSFMFKTYDDETLVGVIDGLGHGPRAHKATHVAREYIESSARQPLESIFRGTDQACTGTRGVVMALAKFDRAAETITFANVGNIDARVDGPEWTGFIVRRGVIGGNNPDVSVVTREWDRSYSLVLHSDGISSGWQFDDIRGDESAGSMANRLLTQYGTSDDDATALVVTEPNDRPTD